MDTNKLLNFIQGMKEDNRIANALLALNRAQLTLLADQIQAPLTDYQPLLEGFSDLIDLMALMLE
jgi:hypothetical protein